MPILKQGEPLPAQNVQAPEVYGVKPQTNSVMFQERLLKLFRPQDWVEIKNIDDEPLFWQYVSIDSEREEYAQGGAMKHIYRDAPEQWYIMPGESEPVPGASAYLALDVLYKTMAAKSTLRQYKDPERPQYNKDGTYTPRNFNFSDANVQEDTIKKAFLGIVTPNFGRPVAEEFRTPMPSAPPAIPQPSRDDQIPTPSTQPNGVPDTQPEVVDRWPLPVDTTQFATPDKPVARAKANAHAGSKR